ncbi:rho guanine nucleotide exchange factor 19-like isoform X2 [Anguilla rostrata]|uniref:rho guanine nucleotide exchange factor 19-like isoform X2 n=1 Tax=Anguilla rostrata TaxID=7938 RepID=UPI0030D2F8FB
MLPGYGFPPLPDFQPHLHALRCRGEGPNMWIPGSPESQALSEARKDRAFPQQPHHHVAVCKQETLAFTELPPPAPNGLGPCPSPNGRSLTPPPDPGEGAGLGPRAALDARRVPEHGEGSSVVRDPSGTERSEGSSDVPVFAQPRPPLTLPLFLPLSSSPDSSHHPHSQRSCSLDLGVCSPAPCSPQRRTSYGDIKEKSIRRKMRVYSPESLSDDSLSSPSPEYKSSSRDRSSGGSSDSAPHSPMGPSPPALLSPPADGTTPLHRGSARLSARKDSIEEHAGTSVTLSSNRLSRFLPSLILYQEYSDVAINREIQRQQGVEPGAEDERLGNGEAGEATPPDNLSPTSSFRSSRGSAFSLWQDIPDVRSSGTLDSFSNEERKLQEAKFELVTSEASYIRSLAIAVDHFMLSRDLSECLGAQERQWLFSKLPDVKDVSERFLQDLEQRLEEDILRFDVCDIVLAHCPALRRVYLPYVTNQAYQEQTYQRLLQENPRFPGILARLEEDPICQRLPLTSFLILPFQRITRLKMLVENILKRTTPGSRDEDTATKAFNELKKIIKECNSSVQSMKRTEELIHLNKKIHFEGKIFPLISQSRWLVKHGELLEVDTQTMSISGSKLKLPTRPVYLHLFNDRLLLSRKKDTWKFVVFVHARIGQLKVKDLSQKLQGISGFIFHLQLCDGPQFKHQILLKARTESEKQRWISAMFPPDLESSGEQTRENDDLSQVQCIKSYQAVEHDELTLEKADILQAKTITSDGWVEGIRLFDGERGWFPKSYVEEITSRTARLRNLRENDRIKCATQKLEEELL